MNRFIFIPLFVLLFLSCSQKEDLSTVSITLPAFPTPHQKSVIVKGPFGLPTPTNIAQYNCFAVFVSWENESGYNSCTLENTTLTLPVLLFKGMAKGGETITLMVPKGPNRIFNIIGSRSQNGTCPSIASLDPSDRRNISPPTVLSNKVVSLTKEKESFSMTISLAGALKIDQCSGPLFSWSKLIAPEGPPTIYSVIANNDQTFTVKGRNLEAVNQITIDKQTLTISSQDTNTITLTAKSVLQLVLNKSYDMVISSAYAADTLITLAITIPPKTLVGEQFQDASIPQTKLGPLLIGLDSLKGSSVIPTGAVLTWNGSSWAPATPVPVIYPTGTPTPTPTPTVVATVSIVAIKQAVFEALPSMLPGGGGAGGATPYNSCPSGYKLVPKTAYNTAYINAPFCVMSSPAQSKGSGVTAGINNYPILTRLDYEKAQSLCSNLGPGYALMNNNEWMAMTTDIMMTGSNWSGNSVGTGELSRGNVANIGTAIPTLSTSDSSRTFYLSNGQILWDVAGNCNQIIDYIVPFLQIRKSLYAHDTPDPLTTPNITMPLTDIRPAEALTPGYTNQAQGLGGYFVTSDVNNENLYYRESYLVLRGGYVPIYSPTPNFTPAPFQGIFSMSLEHSTQSSSSLNSNPSVCFRCVYRLPVGL